MNTDDRRLIAECVRGQSESYGDLVRRYQDRLFNAVFRVLDNADDTLDVVQEAFLNAYQSLNSFKGDSEFFTWLYRIAFNAAISLKRKRRSVLSLEWGGEENNAHEPIDNSLFSQPGDAMERSEEEQKLQQALNRLSTEHRMVLILKDIEGQKYEDIAQILDVPIGTIRSRLHRARLELKDLLESEDD